MGPRIKTTHGWIEGLVENGVRVFRGVPYARAPVGSGRFAPPGPATSWTGTRDATRTACAAPQNPGVLRELIGLPGERTSEDCLYLNVWSPLGGDSSRPVLVWIHGGGFTKGSGGWPVFDGSALARRGDVVVVTLNYRLGALGFLPVGDPDASAGELGNFGLLDQIAALWWLRENAAAFGGDPNAVTLFGESAGAMSIGALLGAPAAHGLFQRAILQSGAARNVHDPEAGDRVAWRFLRELESASADPKRLRELPADVLLAAQERCIPALRGEVSGLAFQPVSGGTTLPVQPERAVGEGRSARIPLLIGTNLDEWKLFGVGDAKARQLDEAGLLRRYRRILPGEDAAGRPRAEHLIETYRQARAGRLPADPPALWFAMESDRWFRHPAMELAARHAVHEPRTFAYLFRWPSPALGGALGSCHALEIPFVFGAVEGGVGRRFVGKGEAAERLSRRMQDAWLAFARDGEPSRSDDVGWPAYEGGRRATRIFDVECGIEEAPLESERAIWDELA